MTNPLDEQIIDFIEAQVAAISTAGGYQTDMDADRVHRPPVGDREFSADDLSDGPHVSIWREEKRLRWLLRYANEMILKVCLTVTAATYAEAVALLGDIERLVATNPRWNDGEDQLASYSWIEESDLPDFDEESDMHSGKVVVCVKTHVDHADPTAVKVI